VRGEGARIWDADGHDYLDFLGEYTAGIYGHSHPVIVEAIREALDGGIVLGGPNRYELALAEAIVERFASIELLRFCNSGTEANLLALTLARIATGREAVVVFDGGYHGGVLSFRGGSSPLNLPFPFTVVPYNDCDAAVRAITDRQPAAVLVEPMQGSGGCIPGERSFLEALRDACDEHGSLLVFDEVMTSRLSTGGLQAVHGIRPDLTTLGKYLGGGLAFGAFGGRADLLERFDPSRADALQHPGTFNNAVMTMAAGVAGLTKVLTADEIARLNALGDRLRARLLEAGIRATGYGSMAGLHFDDAETQTHFHLHMLEHGFSYARRGFVALSVPLTQTDVDGFADAASAFVA
jgi:glutamate-1-semialdehyde 2,1-aminomutase